jgi:hypothetical protein
LIGDAEGDLVIGDVDGDSVTGDVDGDPVMGDVDGDSVSRSAASSSLLVSLSLLQGVLGKQAIPFGHSELLPPGHGFRQLVEAS